MRIVIVVVAGNLKRIPCTLMLFIVRRSFVLAMLPPFSSIERTFASFFTFHFALLFIIMCVCVCVFVADLTVSGLGMVHIQIPNAIQSGRNAIMTCDYELENDDLYAVKWYKGKREFFRYTPKEIPPIKIFKLPGIRVDVSFSILSLGARCFRPFPFPLHLSAFTATAT